MLPIFGNQRNCKCSSKAAGGQHMENENSKRSWHDFMHKICQHFPGRKHELKQARQTEHALQVGDRPWHPELENMSSQNAKLILKTIWGRDKGTDKYPAKWHFQEIFDDPEFDHIEFGGPKRNKQISILFKKIPSERTRELLALYGFKNIAVMAVCPISPNSNPYVTGSILIGVWISNR